MRIVFITSVFFILFFNSCSLVRFARYYASADTPTSGKLEGRVYETKYTSYEIGELSDSWKRIRIEGGDLAFWNDKLRATITVNSTCKDKINYSLKALSESLLTGVTGKQVVQRNELVINGEKALQSVYVGKMDNVPVKLGVVVLKKGNCVYDLSFASLPDNFGGGFADFENFVSRFKVKK